MRLVNYISRCYVCDISQISKCTLFLDACIADSEYRCSNGRCIPDQFKCLGDLEACGEADDNCTSPASEEESQTGGFMSTLGTILKHFLFFMLFVGAVVLIKHMADRFGRNLKDSCGKGCFQIKNKTLVGYRVIWVMYLYPFDFNKYFFRF